jgi:hypothetical protein
MLIGPTGAGKTNFALAIAFAIADATPFLHWSGRRTARVLYIDGEMPARLVKERVQQAAKRHGGMPENLIIVTKEDFPDMPPLNDKGEAGQKFIERLVEKLGRVDFIVFDNMQALIVGTLREDESWAPVLPWVRRLTTMDIGQLWLHHTGHNANQGYGDKTREWQFDTVALMKKPERETPGRLIEFRLEFTKARTRTPSNRADFAEVDIWLDENDAWQSSEVSKQAGKPTKQPSPNGLKFYDALIDALAKPDTAQRRKQSANLASVTMDQWREECFRLGLMDRKEPANKLRATLSKYRLELISAGWIAANDGIVWDTKPKQEK